MGIKMASNVKIEGIVNNIIIDGDTQYFKSAPTIQHNRLVIENTLPIIENSPVPWTGIELTLSDNTGYSLQTTKDNLNNTEIGFYYHNNAEERPGEKVLSIVSKKLQITGDLIVSGNIQAIGQITTGIENDTTGSLSQQLQNNGEVVLYSDTYSGINGKYYIHNSPKSKEGYTIYGTNTIFSRKPLVFEFRMEDLTEDEEYRTENTNMGLAIGSHGGIVAFKRKNDLYSSVMTTDAIMSFQGISDQATQANYDSLNYGRVAYINHSGDFVKTSSEKRKKNIKKKNNNNIQQRYLDLEIDTWTLEDTNELDMGLTVEKTLKVFPRIVSGWADTPNEENYEKKKSVKKTEEDIKNVEDCGIKQSVLLSYTVIALQETIKQVYELQQQVRKLEQEIENNER